MVLTRVWYPCNVLMLTLFWMTRAVIGIRGRTSMCRMNSFWPLGEKTMYDLFFSLKHLGVAGLILHLPTLHIVFHIT